jgi:hypothetical protein
MIKGYGLHNAALPHANMDTYWLLRMVSSVRLSPILMKHLAMTVVSFCLFHDSLTSHIP